MIDALTVVELFEKRLKAGADEPALCFQVDGVFQSLSWSDWNRLSRRSAAGLLALGVQPRDRVAIIGDTSPDWLVTDMAIQMAAATTVALAPSDSIERLAQLLRIARVRLIFADDVDVLRRLIVIREQLPRLDKIIVMRPDAPSAGGHYATANDDSSMNEESSRAHRSAREFLEERCDDLGGRVILLDEFSLIGKESLEKFACQTLESRAALLKPADVSTLVFAVGPDEEPLAVPNTHANHMAVLKGLTQALPMEEEDLLLLALPCGHVRGIVAYRHCIATGTTIALADGQERLAEALRSVRPTVISLTPKLCERIFARISSDVRERGGIEQALFQWAVEVGRQTLRARHLGKPLDRFHELKHILADRAALYRVRELFGGRMRFLIVSGAALRTEVSELLTLSGVPVVESYGLSEVTGISHVERLDRHRAGTVGLPIAGVEVKLAEDSEILLRGPTLMRGYESSPEATARTMAPKGYFRTGDLGTIDERGLLSLTGRKSDTIIMANGHKVSPERIESLLCDNPFISHALVHGDEKNYLVALVALEEHAVRQYSSENNLAVASFHDMTQHPKIFALVDRLVGELNVSLPPNEQIRKFVILDHEFSPETGELTPMMKLRRHKVIDQYRVLLESLYRDTF